jgi:hypothetical protein
MAEFKAMTLQDPVCTTVFKTISLLVFDKQGKSCAVIWHVYRQTDLLKMESVFSGSYLS